MSGEDVYIGSLDHKLHAINAATGIVRWSYPTGWGIADSPTVSGGTVYVGSEDGNVYAINTRTGE